MTFVVDWTLQTNFTFSPEDGWHLIAVIEDFISRLLGGGIYFFSIQDCFERWKDNRMLSLFKRVILLTRKQLATVFARS